MRVIKNIGPKAAMITLILALTDTTLSFSQELPIKLGTQKEAAVNKLGPPQKTKSFSRGRERLFYDDLAIDIIDNKVWMIHSIKSFKGSIFSVRVGDNIYRVNKLLGDPDESDEKRLIYYDHKGNYLNFYLDKNRGTISGFFIRPGLSKEEMEKREKKIAELVARGVIPSDEERRTNMLKKVSHERVTAKEYKKTKRNVQMASTKYQTITGVLKDKNPGLSPVEKSHKDARKMKKFAVEYIATENGVTKRFRQDCFLNKYVFSLKNALNSIKVGDPITIRGRWKYLEDEKKIKKKGIILEQRMSMAIFVVDRIE
jgi:hypothetical protein